jgi:hypothetical protein
LALLSIPAILGLHFFRSQRQTRVIGGLHLWQFAATRQPVGSRWTRLQQSLSLLFQVLTATLVSLLIAGLDLPHQETTAHYTIVLDDSVSMLATGTDRAVDRARAAIDAWAPADARFTVVAAGTRARVLAGPYADRAELLRDLASWQPRAPSCELAPAVQLATRFASGDQKLLFVTDHPQQAAEYGHLLEVLGVGQGLANHAIVFADRLRATADRDRIMISLRSFGTEPAACRVQARVGRHVIYQADPPRQLAPDVTDSFSFQVNLLDAPLEITLDTDALEADNRVVLAPVAVRTIRVHAAGAGDLERFLARAVSATPFAAMEPDPLQADLMVTAVADFPPPRAGAASVDTAASNSANADGRVTAALASRLDACPQAAVICVIPDPARAAAAGVAQGLEILADSESLITRGVPLEEGILWPYLATAAPAPWLPLLSASDVPLLFGGPLTRGGGASRELYFLNVLADRTNIYQTSAWPVLVRNLIEQTRRLLPGTPRANYRLGEQVPVSLDGARISHDGAIQLLRDGAVLETYDRAASLPRILEDLDVGMYCFADGAGNTLATFSVNLFAPAESDLTGAGACEGNLRGLSPHVVARDTQSDPLYLGLSVLVILCTGLAWISQDTSR